MFKSTILKLKSLKLTPPGIDSNLTSLCSVLVSRQPMVQEMDGSGQSRHPVGAPRSPASVSGVRLAKYFQVDTRTICKLTCWGRGTSTSTFWSEKEPGLAKPV